MPTPTPPFLAKLLPHGCALPSLGREPHDSAISTGAFQRLLIALPSSACGSQRGQGLGGGHIGSLRHMTYERFFFYQPIADIAMLLDLGVRQIDIYIYTHTHIYVVHLYTYSFPDSFPYEVTKMKVSFVFDSR